MNTVHNITSTDWSRIDCKGAFACLQTIIYIQADCSYMLIDSKSRTIKTVPFVPTKRDLFATYTY